MIVKLSWKIQDLSVMQNILFLIYKQELNSRRNTWHAFFPCASRGFNSHIDGGPHHWSNQHIPDLQGAHLGCRWWWNGEDCWHGWENPGETPSRWPGLDTGCGGWERSGLDSEVAACWAWLRWVGVGMGKKRKMPRMTCKFPAWSSWVALVTARGKGGNRARQPCLDKTCELPVGGMEAACPIRPWCVSLGSETRHQWRDPGSEALGRGEVSWKEGPWG